MRKFISAEAEFYLGLLTTLLVALLIPMLVSATESSSWPFLGYLYLPVGIVIILHASLDTLDPTEKGSIISSLGILGRLLARQEKETK